MRVFLFILFMVTFIYSEGIELSSFINSGFPKKITKKHLNKLDKLASQSNGIPFIKDIELRYSLDWYDDQQHNIKTRFKFKSFNEHKCAGELIKSRIKTLKSEYNMKLNKKLYLRYVLFLENLRLKNRINFINQEIVIKKDLVKISASTIPLDYDLMLKSKKSQIDYNIKLMELKRKIKKNEQKISKVINFDSNSFFILNLIDVNHIEKIVEFLYDVKFDTTLYVKNYLNKKNEEYSRLKFEKVKKFSFLSYIDIGLNRKVMDGIYYNKTPIYESFYYGAGINLPIDFSGKNERINLELKKAKNSDNYKDAINKIEKKYDKKYDKIKFLIEEYRYLTSKAVQNVYRSELEVYTQQEDADPKVVLRAKENLLSLNKRISEIYNEILVVYVDLIDLKGYLQKKGNWLDKNIKL